MMETLTVAIPHEVAAELKHEATERGLLVAELAGLILHAALIERKRCAKGNNDD